MFENQHHHGIHIPFSPSRENECSNSGPPQRFEIMFFSFDFFILSYKTSAQFPESRK